MNKRIIDLSFYILKGLFILTLKIIGGFFLMLGFVNMYFELNVNNSILYDICSAYLLIYFLIFTTSACLFLSYKIDQKFGLFELLVIAIDFFIIIKGIIEK